MYARRARALLHHWSAQPARSAALCMLVALLALAGPAGCWLHCQIHSGSTAGGHNHAAALADWAQPSSEHSHHAAATEHSQHGELSGCAGQSDAPSALTVGVVALLALLAVPRSRRRPPHGLAARLLTWDHSPLFPPPRHAFDASIVR